MTIPEFVRLLEDADKQLARKLERFWNTVLHLPLIDFSPEGFYRYPGPFKALWRRLTGWYVVPFARLVDGQSQIRYQWVHPNWHESDK